MKPAYKAIVGALIFSILLIASAYFLKRNPAKDWVDAGIYMIGIYCWFRYYMPSGKARPPKFRDC